MARQQKDELLNNYTKQLKENDEKQEQRKERALINKVKQEIRLEKLAEQKKRQQEIDAQKVQDLGGHNANSKLMTTLFPDIIRNQQDIIRKRGDPSHYSKTMELALKRQDEII